MDLEKIVERQEEIKRNKGKPKREPIEKTRKIRIKKSDKPPIIITDETAIVKPDVVKDTLARGINTELKEELDETKIKLKACEKEMGVKKEKPFKTKKIKEPKEKLDTTMKKKIPVKEAAVKEEQESSISGERLNEKFIDLMGKLVTLMGKKGEGFKARAYKKAEETIMSFTTDITSPSQLKGKPGIGDTIMKKLMEFQETGTLRLLEREKDNPENILSDVYGIGPAKAKELVAKGITTIAELRTRQEELLNDSQKKGLKYYEDILERIPRAEIDEYSSVFKSAFDKVKQEDSRYEIVGSYRRGAKQSGDIDVIITSKNHEVFKNFIDLLVKQKIIVEVLSQGKTKCLVITKIESSKHARRVDFLYTTVEEYPFSVLYFTGSKAFNTVMRGHALKMGYSLNEHALSTMDGKTKGAPVDHVFKSEKDIFDFLKLTYKEPTERIDGRAVIKKDGTPVLVVSERQNTLVEEPAAPKEEEVPAVPKEKEEPAARIEIKKTRKIRIPKKQINDKEEKQIKEVPSGESTTHIEDFKTKGISILEHLTEQQLSAMLLASNAAYYNTKTALMTDNQYDILKEYIERKYPKNQAITKVGAPVEKNKVKLPYEMASMDKIKPDSNALPNWVKKYTGPYVLSCKLDGVSGMYSTEGEGEGQVPKLYTRGDGKVGQDVSHLIPLLKLPNHKDTVVRGEFIIPKKVFEDKYKDRFANPRNLVSGIVNAKTTDEKVHDLHFVAYEVIKPSLKPSEQMALLKELRHEVVMNRATDELTNESLSETLLDWRKSYEYEIDGVIVIDDKVHPRASGNPDYAFAFKMVISDQIAEAKVVDVIWNASKDGYLKPRVRIEPIRLGGVTIEYATGFNGKFIEENKIGIGAVIEIIRSGDVIPYIKEVTQPAERGKMPDVPYKWSDKHVDIMLENKGEDVTVKEKNITAFFVELEVDGLSGGNVKRIMKAGFDSIPKILRMTKTDYEGVEGFQEKMVEKIYNGIKEKVASANLLTVMKASNMLGRGLGERKLRPILERYPSILTSKEAPDEKVKMLRAIDGIGPENAKTFVANIPAFLAFLRECDLEGKLSQNVLRKLTPKIGVTTNPLYGKKIVMTKIRDKDIIEHLPKVGATLEDNIKKDTFVLIVKSKTDSSNKTKYAEENGIAIMEPAEFKQKFMA